MTCSGKLVRGMRWAAVNGETFDESVSLTSVAGYKNRGGVNILCVFAVWWMKAWNVRVGRGSETFLLFQVDSLLRAGCTLQQR